MVQKEGRKENLKCMMCDEAFEVSCRSGEIMIQCQVCKQWAHEDCTSMEVKRSGFVCDFCQWKSPIYWNWTFQFLPLCLFSLFSSTACLLTEYTWTITLRDVYNVPYSRNGKIIKELSPTYIKTPWFPLPWKLYIISEVKLSHCSLMTPYGDMDLGQHWLR